MPACVWLSMQMPLSMSPLMVKVMKKIARNHGHSTNMQAAQVATEAGAKRLLLNHISARFLSKDIGQLKKDAASIFENVHVVKDLEEVEI